MMNNFIDMKNTNRLFALLIILCCLVLSGCAQKTYSVPWDPFCYFKGEHGQECILLSGKEKSSIIDILNDGDWQGGQSEQEGDFLFYTQKQQLSYHSESGTFNDLSRQKTLILSEDQRDTVNSILNTARSSDQQAPAKE